MNEEAIDEEDKGKNGTTNSSSSRSSNNNLSDRCTVILSGKRSETAIKVWQRRYCEYHIGQGHAGYCYAWLDNAFCPQFHLTGSCRMLHVHPNAWTNEQKAQHIIQIEYMKDLWKDSSLFEVVSDGDNDSENGDPIVTKDSRDERSTYLSTVDVTPLPAVSNAIAHAHQLPISSVESSERETSKRRRVAE